MIGRRGRDAAKRNVDGLGGLGGPVVTPAAAPPPAGVPAEPLPAAPGSTMDVWPSAAPPVAPAASAPSAPSAPSAAKKPALYKLTDVRRVYKTGGGEVRALDGVSLEIGVGELVAIEGSSGSGKSTLLQLLGGLDTASSGEVSLDGRDLGRLGGAALTDVRCKEIGFVFQSFNLIPTLSAAENVEAAMVPLGGDRRTRRLRAVELLTRVGLGNRADHLPSTMSGGEQQRVAIARALANQPRVLLADEPTGNLDSATSDEVVGVLRTLSQASGVTVVLVTHAPEVAAVAPRRIRVKDGKILSDSADEAAAFAPA